MGMEDKIFNVIVPVEKETEKRNGKEKVVERKSVNVTSLSVVGYRLLYGSSA